LSLAAAIQTECPRTSIVVPHKESSYEV